MDFKNFKEMFNSKRIKELEAQLEKNNPILEEAADYIEALETKVEELQSSHDALEAKLAKYENLEPVAWVCVNEDGECEQIDYGSESPLPGDDGFIPLYALERK